MRPDSHTQLLHANKCLCPLFFGGGGGICNFFRVSFMYHCIAVSSLYGECLVRFPSGYGVFLLVTTGWIFDISLL